MHVVYHLTPKADIAHTHFSTIAPVVFGVDGVRLLAYDYSCCGIRRTGECKPKSVHCGSIMGRTRRYSSANL